MYGEIPAQEVEAKSPLIEEGGIFVISRFRVSNAKSGYRAVDARYMVEFTLHTTVVAARDDMPDFPRYAYKITPIDALTSHAGDTRNFLGQSIPTHDLFIISLFLCLKGNMTADTIGTLVEVSDVYPVRLPNKPAPTLSRHIVLRDLRLHSFIPDTICRCSITYHPCEHVFVVCLFAATLKSRSLCGVKEPLHSTLSVSTTVFRLSRSLFCLLEA
jgi:hypothetical protein